MLVLGRYQYLISRNLQCREGSSNESVKKKKKRKKKKEKNFLRLYLNLIYTNSEAKLVIAALIKFKAKISPRREEIYEISDRGGEGEEGEGGSS